MKPDWLILAENRLVDTLHMVDLPLIYKNNLSELFLADPVDHHAASFRTPNQNFKYEISHTILLKFGMNHENSIARI